VDRIYEEIHYLVLTSEYLVILSKQNKKILKELKV